jgi:hypothetical protein
LQVFLTIAFYLFASSSWILRISSAAIDVTVDWQTSTGNGHNLTSTDITESGILELAHAVAQAAGVWYNLTKVRMDLSHSDAFAF